jgi:hypothetical protein
MFVNTSVIFTSDCYFWGQIFLQCQVWQKKEFITKLIPLPFFPVQYHTFRQNVTCIFGCC